MHWKNPKMVTTTTTLMSALRTRFATLENVSKLKASVLHNGLTASEAERRSITATNHWSLTIITAANRAGSRAWRRRRARPGRPRARRASQWATGRHRRRRRARSARCTGSSRSTCVRKWGRALPEQLPTLCVFPSFIQVLNFEFFLTSFPEQETLPKIPNPLFPINPIQVLLVLC